jgi:hypothetical protein
MRVVRALLILAVAAAAGCDQTDPNQPTPITQAAVTDIFTGTLAPGASSFYSFPVFIDGSVRLTLASVTAGTTANGAALTPSLVLGLGIPSGTDCATLTTANASPDLVPQIDGYGITPGTYCVRIADPGSLSATVSFAIRMTYPIAPIIVPGLEKTENFDTTLAVGGSSSRTVTASKAGTTTISLESLGGGVARVGMGFGIPRTDGTCAFTRSVESGPGPGSQISLSVVAGTYCLRVYDVGLLTAPVGFNVKVVYP